MKKLLLVLALLLLVSCSSDQVRPVVPGEISRIDDVIQEVKQLPETTATRWTISSLQECKATLTNSQTVIQKLTEENSDLRTQLAKVEAERTTLAQSAGQGEMIRYLLYAALAFIGLFITYKVVSKLSIPGFGG